MKLEPVVRVRRHYWRYALILVPLGLLILAGLYWFLTAIDLRALNP